MLVAAREAVRAIAPEIAIVDEAIATSSHVRKFLNSDSPNQHSFLRGGGLGWGMPARRVTRARDIAPAIEEGIASGRANVVEVMIGTK